jgi:hypothetical protein
MDAALGDAGEVGAVDADAARECPVFPDRDDEAEELNSECSESTLRRRPKKKPLRTEAVSSAPAREWAEW